MESGVFAMKDTSPAGLVVSALTSPAGSQGLIPGKALHQSKFFEKWTLYARSMVLFQKNKCYTLYQSYGSKK